MLREIISAWENHTTHVSTISGQNSEFIVINGVCVCSYHCAIIPECNLISVERFEKRICILYADKSAYNKVKYGSCREKHQRHMRWEWEGWVAQCTYHSWNCRWRGSRRCSRSTTSGTAAQWSPWCRKSECPWYICVSRRHKLVSCIWV
jgi:hypothetical protein